MDGMGSELFSCSIFPATPAQVVESRYRSFADWGNGLTREQYLDRDAAFDQLEHANDGKLTTWVLAPRDEPGSLDFKCSCETYRRRGLVLQHPALPDVGRQVKTTEVVCYGIASVYTPPSKRGKGYARHMMRLLHWVLAPESTLPEAFPEIWGAPPLEAHRKGDAQFSTLWSDVGHDFYRNCGPAHGEEQRTGWIIRGHVSTSWEVDNWSGTKDGLDGEWEWLDEEGAGKIWERDVEWIKKDMVMAALSPACGRVWFTYLPDHGVGAFQHRRDTFFLEQESPMVKRVGLASPGLTSSESSSFDETTAFATWTLQVRPPPSRTLIVTRLRANQNTFRGLLEQIIKTAEKYGMKKVEIWNLPRELVNTAEELGGVSHERDEHLPAFKWYGQEDNDDLIWLFNEKFCWC